MSDDAVTVVADPPKPEVHREPRRLRGQSIVVSALSGSWLWPSIFMAAVSVRHISRPEMWQDELVTISVVSRSTRQILSLLQSVDAVHGVYYLFMHGWVHLFGDSPTFIRMPSALAMTGTAACVALIGQRLFGRSAGIAGGFVFAVIPAISRFAQEARSYAFLVLFVALATLLLLVALDRSAVVTWAGYAACVAAVAYLNTVALALLIGHLAGILVSCERGRVWRTLLKFGLAALVGILPATPVIYMGMQQATRQINWLNQEPHAVWLVLPRIFASDRIGWAVAALLAVAVARYRRRAAFPAAVALMPMLAIWLVSLGKLNYFFSKYLLFVIPVWAVLAGAGLTALRWKASTWWNVVPAVGLAVLAVMSVPDQRAVRGSLSHSDYTYPAAPPMGPLAYREAAGVIAANYQPGDAIGYPMLPRIWWFMHDKGVSYYLPKNVRLRQLFLQKSAAQNNELYVAQCPVPEQCFGNERRVWIVIPYQTDNPVGQFADEQRKFLVPDYVLVLLEHKPGLTIALIQHK